MTTVDVMLTKVSISILLSSMLRKPNQRICATSLDGCAGPPLHGFYGLATGRSWSEGGGK